VEAVDQRSTLEGETAESRSALLRRIMRRQAALSLRVSAIFVLLLLALPLANLYLPSLMGADVAGFTLTWLVLGVLFYPITWALSGYFVKESERVESSIARDEGTHAANVASGEAVSTEVSE
jgi:uncharacterized membrane protein (DUF485 family)